MELYEYCDEEYESVSGYNPVGEQFEVLDRTFLLVCDGVDEQKRVEVAFFDGEKYVLINDGFTGLETATYYFEKFIKCLRGVDDDLGTDDLMWSADYVVDVLNLVGERCNPVLPRLDFDDVVIFMNDTIANM